MRRRRMRTTLATVSALALVLGACGDAEEDPAEADNGDEAAVEDEGDAEAGADADGLEDFDEDLVSAAQEEGSVALYAGGHTREGVELLAEMFTEDFGIEVEFVREDSGSVVQMVEAELSGGALNADVVSLTDAPSLLRWSEEGTITDVDLPHGDRIMTELQVDGPFVPYSLVPLGIMYNESVTEDVPQSWDALAAEDFEDFVVMANPSASGTALMFVHMMTELMGDDWWDALAERNIIVTDSALALAQMTVTGEADFGIPAIESAVAASADEGEPLAIAFPEEGIPSFTSAVAALSEAPNPSAGELLVQYHISPRFQEALTQLGARTVLEDGPQPPDAPDFSDANLLTPDFGALDAEAEELRERFDARFR